MVHRLNHQWMAPLGSRKCFFARGRIERSQVMSMVKFSPIVLNFGYDFVLLVHFLVHPVEIVIWFFLSTWYLYVCVKCACIRVAVFICDWQCVIMNVSTFMCESVCVCVTVCLSALRCFMHAWVSFCVWMLGSTAYWWVGLRGISCGCSQPSTTILMSFELGTYSSTLDLPCWTMLFSCLLGSAWFNCAICSWEDLNALQMER